MKKLFLLLTLFAVVSCSKEEVENATEDFTLTKDYLVGTTWSLYSYNGNTDLDECDFQEQIEFTEDEMIQTLAYWGDSFLEEDCRTMIIDTRYKVEDERLKIEYDGSSDFASFKDKNTLEISTYYSDFNISRVYKKN